MDVQKLCGPRISQFLPCMPQFLDNLWRLFICSNYIGEEDHFTLEPLKRFDTQRWTRISSPQLKIKNQTMAYRWTFKKDPLKLEEIL